MSTKDEVKDSVKDGVKTVVGMAQSMIEVVPEELDKLVKLLEDRNTEIRLKFEHLTLDGDIALSMALFKKGEKTSPKK